MEPQHKAALKQLGVSDADCNQLDERAKALGFKIDWGKLIQSILAAILGNLTPSTGVPSSQVR